MKRGQTVNSIISKWQDINLFLAEYEALMRMATTEYMLVTSEQKRTIPREIVLAVDKKKKKTDTTNIDKLT